MENGNHPSVCCDNQLEVIVVGNGPSAIALSFMLSGWRPYYNGKPLPNEFLMKRLEENIDQCLLDKDLELLCEGLEGRSNNPVALLFDHLHHPNADLGEDNPSVLNWVYQPEFALPHVVLGKTKAGGTWQKIDGSMQTISQNTWMEMPTLPFKKWLESSDRRISQMLDLSSDRATIKDVKEYYLDFVKTRHMERHFMDYHTVTSVQNFFHTKNFVDDESGEVEPCCRNIRRNHPHCWEVRGYETIKGEDGEDSMGRKDFTYIAPHVVLATGAYDISNRLEVEGENLPNVIHSPGEYEKKISSGEVSTNSDPIVVVGSGLSAADCILLALENNIPVIHVFRRSPFDPSLIFSKLPGTMYPEYHHIHSLMKGKTECELYKPMPRHSVVEIMPGKILVKKLQKSANSIVAHFDISIAAIMIGSRSDLSFLPYEGRRLGVVQNWPLDSKHNVMDVDPYSYQSNHEPQLFALGPLVGDNFVRFGIGGALGVTHHLNRCGSQNH